MHYQSELFNPDNMKPLPNKSSVLQGNKGITNVGDMILEPFCGSGTTPLVAKRLNRHCIAYEIDEGVHAAACERVFT